MTSRSLAADRLSINPRRGLYRAGFWGVSPHCRDFLVQAVMAHGVVSGQIAHRLARFLPRIERKDRRAVTSALFVFDAERIMKPVSRFLILLLLALGLGESAGPAAASDVEVLNAEFGLFSNGPFGGGFKVSKTVPVKAGQAFGWRIYLKTNKRSVHFREVFELPRPPKIWGAPAGQEVSADRKTSIIEHDVPVSSGFVQNIWSVAPGDPCGDSMIHVFIEGSEAATFHFSFECEAI
jgi:hypothetical protein